MKTKRMDKLNEVFEKFMKETLKPMSKENLEKIMQNFPKDCAENFSRLCYHTIETNSTDEFKQIVAEKKIEERLEKLDQLIENSKPSYNLNMSAFEFEEHDPERVKRKIVCDAKRQEISRLQLFLRNLNENNEKLEAKNTEIQKQLDDARLQIQETQNELEKKSNQDNEF